MAACTSERFSACASEHLTHLSAHLVSAIALPPKLVRHMSAVWPPCARHVSALAASPPLVSASRVCVCPPCVRSLSAMCPLFASSGPPSVLASGLCPLVACCGAGPWHHKVKFFLSIATRRVYIACPLVSLLGIHFGCWLHKFRSLQVHPMLEKLFGVYAGILKTLNSLYLPEQLLNRNNNTLPEPGLRYETSALQPLKSWLAS